MLEAAEINRRVFDIASRHLSALGVEEVISEPAIDSQGNEAVRITIVVADASKIPESGHALVATLVEVNREFEEDGRFPMIGYASREELAEIDDPEA